MVDSTRPLIDSWESKIRHGGGMAKIGVITDLQTFCEDVIWKVCFGSSTFDGKEMFFKIRELQTALTEPNLLVEIFWLRYLPTKRNRQVWRLKKEVRAIILNLVQKTACQDRGTYEGILYNVHQNVRGMENADDLVVDNCKIIQLVGRETIATTAAWCLLLLSHSQDWQRRVRTEISKVCGGDPPSFRQLKMMNTLNMVIEETLRLYPPVAFIARETLDDMTLGDIDVPKGVHIYIHIQAMHHDESTWGPDVNDFNPERFNRCSMNCKPNTYYMYAPFGGGQRSCLGRDFAMLELKTLLSAVLSKFAFQVSPDYMHSPSMRMLVEAEFGVDLIVDRIN